MPAVAAAVHLFASHTPVRQRENERCDIVGCASCIHIHGNKRMRCVFNCISARVSIHAWIGMCSHAECVCYGISSSRTGYGCKYLIRHSFFLSLVCSFILLCVFFGSFLWLCMAYQMCALTHIHTHRTIQNTPYKMYAEKNGSHIYSAMVFVWTVWFNGCTLTYTCKRTRTHCVQHIFNTGLGEKRDTKGDANAAAIHRVSMSGFYFIALGMENMNIQQF